MLINSSAKNSKILCFSVKNTKNIVLKILVLKEKKIVLKNSKNIVLKILVLKYTKSTLVFKNTNNLF